MRRRRRIAVLVVALLGVAGVAIWLLRPLASSTARHDEKPAATTADATHSGKAVAPAATADTAETSASRTPSAVPITPEEFAKAWQARALKTIRNKNARLLGEEVANLLALPADKAWAALTQRARDGDANAAAAAMHLARECMAKHQGSTSQIASTPSLSSQYKDLPAEVLQRLRGIEALQSDQLATRSLSCAGISGEMEFIKFAINRFLRDDDPAVQRDMAQEIAVDADAIALLRDLERTQPDIETTRALGERLLRSVDPDQQAEGRSSLEALARSGDEQALGLLAECLRIGCGAFNGDTGTATAWQQDAARLGNWAALQREIDDSVQAHAAATAWAWSRYRVDLAQQGCYEIAEPSMTWLAEAQRVAAKLDTGLTPTQRIEGEDLLRQLLSRWSAQARSAQGCG